MTSCGNCQNALLNWLARSMSDMAALHVDMKQYVELSKTQPRDAYSQVVAFAGKRAEKLDDALHDAFGWILYRYCKSRCNELSSREVRGLLFDYIKLKNQRPSLLHSVVLGFALGFAKEHTDFIFPKFLEYWGFENFREEDCEDNDWEGKVVPSLLSRVCARLAVTDTPMVNEIAEGTKLSVACVADLFRSHWYWTLYELQKDGRMDDFWKTAGEYVGKYGIYPASACHSKIMKLCYWKMDAAHDRCFLVVAVSGCRDAGFAQEDWKPQTGKDGGEFPPFAVQLVKKCFECVRNDASARRDVGLLKGLARMYDNVEKHGAGDEWTARQRAMLSAWTGDKADAAARYRRLLQKIGDKFYVWQEMAQLVDDAWLRCGYLLRALEVEKNEGLIGPLRLQTAEVLLQLGYPREAEKLLDAYSKHRQSEGKPCVDIFRKLEMQAAGALVARLAVCVDKYKKLEMQVKAALGGSGASGGRAVTSGVADSKGNGTSNKNGAFDAKRAVLDAMNDAYKDCPWQECVFLRSIVVNDKPKMVFTTGKGTFMASSKRFSFEKLPNKGDVFEARLSVSGSEVVPMMLRPVDEPSWSVLPGGLGCVAWVNEEKCAVSVVTPASHERCFIDKEKRFKSGDFVLYRYYMRRCKDGTVACEIVNPQLCADKDAALKHFKSSIAVVDDVNLEKSLFHIVLEADRMDGVVHFNETESRPHVGDFFQVVYCMSRDKAGNMRLLPIDIRSTEGRSDKLVRDVDGLLELTFKNSGGVPDFGFVDRKYYVPKSLLEALGITEDCQVSGKAVATGKDRKWRVFRIDDVYPPECWKGKGEV